MNRAQLTNYVNQLWDNEIIPALIEYIKIPNKSPQFDQNWQKNGYMQQAVTLIESWCKKHAPRNMKIDVIQFENRTPLIMMDIPGKHQNETILLYGHLDKQPEMSGWRDDLSPWTPVLEGDRLYGRGAADDGYAAFASLAAIKSLEEQSIPHARCVILIEASEESGSSDLPFYVEKLKDKIGHPDLIICLDSGCGNYDQLWMTTSLRGLVGGILTIDTLREGIHSGFGSGVAPSCFRILRLLLDRLEESETGNIKLHDLHVSIPAERIEQAEKAASALGQGIIHAVPFLKNVTAEGISNSDRLIRRTWQPALSVTGMDGMPVIANAGNVTLPSLRVKLSMRLAPTCDPTHAAKSLQSTLEYQPPYGAQVTFDINDTGPGWNAPAQSDWLIQSANQASKAFFGKEAMYMGEGGTIPFMGMLGEKFPHAQFVITGVLGPESNAHGPNEFLHIPTGKKLTACIAQVIADHEMRHEKK